MKDDEISRKAVLKLLAAMPPEEAMTKAMLIQSVKQMDAAQPELPDTNVGDTISRYGVAAWLDNMGYTKLAYAVMDKDRFPSAQPERKRGKWVFYEDRAPVWDIAEEKTWARAYKCSECGFVHSVIEDFGQYAFCPNCGADMRGEQK